MVLAENSATLLSSSPNPAYFGQAVTLSATVKGAVGTPTGSFTFYDGAAVLSTVPLDSSAHASFTTSTLAVGSHPLSAVYAGNTIYATSKSPVVNEVILAPPQDFTIALATPNLTIRTQHHATTSVTLSSINGLSDSLALTCGNLPKYLTCRLTPNPQVLTANSSPAVALYLDTDSVLGYARNSLPAPRTPGTAPIFSVVLLAPFGLLASRRARHAPALRIVLLSLFGVTAAVTMTGCGEIIITSEIPPSVAPGTYTIPITATGGTTGISHTAVLNLTVTP